MTRAWEEFRFFCGVPVVEPFEAQDERAYGALGAGCVGEDGDEEGRSGGGGRRKADPSPSFAKSATGIRDDTIEDGRPRAVTFRAILAFGPVAGEARKEWDGGGPETQLSG